MTTPSIFAAGYTSASLTEAPVLRNGAAQHVRTVATIPAATATSTNVGLIPFQKGCRVVMDASSVYVTDADTGSSATATLGWVYDDNATYTNDENGLATTSTAPQGAGVIACDAAAGYSFEAEAPGWIIIQTGGETVEVEYTATADFVISYNT